MVFSLGVLAFVGAGFFGMCQMGMSGTMHGAMSMSHCPLMPGSTSPLEHLSAWQGMFENVFKLQDATSFLLFLILAIVFLVVAWKEFSFLPSGNVYASRFRSEERPLSFSPFLNELFSDGILNPKTF